MNWYKRSIRILYACLTRYGIIVIRCKWAKLNTKKLYQNDRRINIMYGRKK